MESSAERALEIGLNVFVFIIALTCSLLLMTNVLKISELASTIIKDTGNSTLMELYGETNERIYSGNEMFAIISEYISDTNNIKSKIILRLNSNGVEKDIINPNITVSEFNDSYTLKYMGMEEDISDNLYKKVYVFSKVQVETM